LAFYFGLKEQKMATYTILKQRSFRQNFQKIQQVVGFNAPHIKSLEGLF